jgi:hypothetical protein
MAAPTTAARVKKALANPEPSTHTRTEGPAQVIGSSSVSSADLRWSLLRKTHLGSASLCGLQRLVRCREADQRRLLAFASLGRPTAQGGAPSDPWRPSGPNRPWRPHLPDGGRGWCPSRLFAPKRLRSGPRDSYGTHWCIFRVRGHPWVADNSQSFPVTLRTRPESFHS